MTRWLVVLFAGCAPLTEEEEAFTTAECAEVYSPENGYGWESDSTVTPERVQEDCEALGRDDCDASEFLTREAARCVALAEGLEPEPLDLSLHLEVHHEQPTWHVHALISDDGSNLEYHGLMLNAATGVVAEDVTWTEGPASTGSS